MVVSCLFFYLGVERKEFFTAQRWRLTLLSRLVARERGEIRLSHSEKHTHGFSWGVRINLEQNSSRSRLGGRAGGGGLWHLWHMRQGCCVLLVSATRAFDPHAHTQTVVLAVFILIFRFAVVCTLQSSVRSVTISGNRKISFNLTLARQYSIFYKWLWSGEIC